MTQSLPDQLRTAVRFLGRLLGDVIRAEDGEAVFSQIEDIRRASVAFHREGTEKSATLMAEKLAGLSLPETVRFAHSFVCFLQITNIAEDQTQRRRGRAGDAAGDTLAGALRSLKAEGVGVEAVVELLRHALIAPVITAHPSEVRRKSVLDRVRRHRRRPGRLRPRPHRRGAGGDRARADAPGLDLLAHPPAPPVKPGVKDEIENAVSYFERSFLPELPRLYAHWLEVLGGPKDLTSSCASAPGSAATATAIPSSPPRSCARPCAGSRGPRCGSISTPSMPWARSCRSPGAWPA